MAKSFNGGGSTLSPSGGWGTYDPAEQMPIKIRSKNPSQTRALDARKQAELFVITKAVGINWVSFVTYFNQNYKSQPFRLVQNDDYFRRFLQHRKFSISTLKSFIASVKNAKMAAEWRAVIEHPDYKKGKSIALPPTDS